MMIKRAAVVVLVVVLGLCAGLGTVGVVQVRQAAGRMRCQNNVKQFAFAFESYLITYPHFPRGTIRNPDLPVERRLSWALDIWSFMEAHMVLHERTKAWDAEGPNRRSARYPLAVFCCPANPERTTEEGFGAIHYVGIAGLGEEAARLPAGHPDAGVFGYDRVTRPEEIKDGRATTLLLVETTRVLGPAWLAGGPPAVRGLDPDEEPYLGRDGQFGSLHRAGVLTGAVLTHALMADCSIRAVRQDIDPSVLRALVTVAGGEEVPPDW
jgi:hypothetical protein